MVYYPYNEKIGEKLADVKASAKKAEPKVEAEPVEEKTEPAKATKGKRK